MAEYREASRQKPAATDAPSLPKQEKSEQPTRRTQKTLDERNVPPGYTARFVGGHGVVFPGVPYPVQLPYMERVVRALDASENALLEAPTGVGKTRALLCASMQWLQDEQKTYYERLQSQLFTVSQAAAAITAPTEQPSESTPSQIQLPTVPETKPMGVIGDEDSAAMRDSLWQFSCASSRRQPHKREALESTDTGDANRDLRDQDVMGSGKKIKTEAPTLSRPGEIQLLSDMTAVPLDPTAEDGSLKAEAEELTEAESVRLLHQIWADVPSQQPETKHSKAERAWIQPKISGDFRKQLATGDSESESVRILHQIWADVRQQQPESRPAVPMPPRIFYASRTHSQLSQARGPLHLSHADPISRSCLSSNAPPTSPKPPFWQGSSFREALMAGGCGQGARKHYCIHPRVKKERDVDAACSNLLKNKAAGSCQYFINTRRMRAERDWPVQDIEELGNYAKEKGFCPYYLSRSRMGSSELILSPYNYLISPSIRTALEINVQEAGVILDEAHNIEDVCREAASFESDLEKINLSRKSFESKRIYYETHDEATATACGVLESTLEGIVNMLQQFIPEDTHYRQYRREGSIPEKIFTATQTMSLLEEAGLSSPQLVAIREAYETVKDLEEPQETDWDPEHGPADAPQRSTAPLYIQFEAALRLDIDITAGMALIVQLVMVLKMMFQGPSEFTEAFKMCIRAEKRADASGSRRKSFGTSWDIHMFIWCFNAAVSFSQISGVCRSVILTSGTLSPLSSFASELGTEFKYVLECRHVVDMEKQVWASACAVDSSGTEICCTYQNTQSSSLWDRIGTALLNWCRVVPDGVLVFLPSFRVLDHIMDRWKETKQLEELKKLKAVFSESRAGSENFDDVIQGYYRTIDQGKGALFFGVCRGKASEGVNFADGYARSVIMVGIPYPALMDPKVRLKKEYNSRWAKQLGLCDGAVWYNQQAFRALNQGIGRCIRHKDDYGAILLLDSRYMHQEKLQNVSRWVRTNIQRRDRFDLMLKSVEAFFKKNSSQPDPPVASLDHKVAVSEPALIEAKQQICLPKASLKQEVASEKHLVGFEALIEETVDRDIQAFGRRILDAGYFSQNQLREAHQAARRSMMDCLLVSQEHAENLTGFFRNWKHVIPTGLAALFRLRQLPFSFPAMKPVPERHQLSSNGPLDACLHELRQIYLRHLEVAAVTE